MMQIKLKYRWLEEGDDLYNLDYPSFKESKSWTLQFFQSLGGLFQNSHTDQITDTGGTARTWATNSTSLNIVVDAGAGDVTHGLVVGTGTNAERADDTALQTLIAHGVGAGQLQYGACAVTEATTGGGTGDNIDVFITRSFTNNSGSSITVQEIGMYYLDKYSINNYYFCGIRDLSTQAIADGVAKTLQYTIRGTN